MPKMLKFGVNVLSFLMYLALFGLVLGLVVPIGFLIDGFGSNVAKSIVTDSEYLVVLHHTHVSSTAITNFPSGVYGVLMAAGSALSVIAGLMMVWAGLQLLGNLVKKQYFVSDNVKQLKRIVIAQIIAVFSDGFVATANQLIKTDLYRVNSTYPVDWNDPLQDLVMLVIIGLVYYIYQRAVALKEESELTI